MQAMPKHQTIPRKQGQTVQGRKIIEAENGASFPPPLQPCSQRYCSAVEIFAQLMPRSAAKLLTKDERDVSGEKFLPSAWCPEWRLPFGKIHVA